MNDSLGIQQGVTLIELMVVIIIIGIIASIALPSYRQYMISNNIKHTQSEMMLISSDIERWRTKALSYRGYAPSDNTKILNADKTIVLSPRIGKLYTVYLAAVKSDSTTDVIDKATNHWIMLAKPNGDAERQGYPNLVLSSHGVRCKSIDRSLRIDSVVTKNCGTGSTSW